MFAGSGLEREVVVDDVEVEVRFFRGFRGWGCRGGFGVGFNVGFRFLSWGGWGGFRRFVGLDGRHLAEAL
jgi:hypothetical protein